MAAQHRRAGSGGAAFPASHSWKKLESLGLRRPWQTELRGDRGMGPGDSAGSGQRWRGGAGEGETGMRMGWRWRDEGLDRDGVGMGWRWDGGMRDGNLDRGLGIEGWGWDTDGGMRDGDGGMREARRNAGG